MSWVRYILPAIVCICIFEWKLTAFSPEGEEGLKKKKKLSTLVVFIECFFLLAPHGLNDLDSLLLQVLSFSH